MAPVGDDYAQVRRQDRSVEDEAWIASMLHRAAVATVATASGEQAFINTNLFVFDQAARAIYLHTAVEGRLRSNLSLNDRVCLAVSEMGRLLPAASAFGMGVEYAGVVVFGRASVVAGASDKRRALQMLLDKYFPHLRPEEDYRPPTDDELEQTSVYRIDIEEWSGKRRQAEAEFPGAFAWAGPSAPSPPDPSPEAGAG